MAHSSSSSSSAAAAAGGQGSPLVTVRAVTAFLNLQSQDAEPDGQGTASALSQRIQMCSELVHAVQAKLTAQGHVVQTLRIATNAFHEWLTMSPDGSQRGLDVIQSILDRLAVTLEQCDIEFFSFGPASSVHEIETICPMIVRSSQHFSCSAPISEHCGDQCPSVVSDGSTMLDRAKATARTILHIASMGEQQKSRKDDAAAAASSSPSPPSFVQNGLGNFRFCAAASCRPYIPFFPAAKSCSNAVHDASTIGFAIGLENGNLTTELLKKCGSIGAIPTTFRNGFAERVRPVQDACLEIVKERESLWDKDDGSGGSHFKRWIYLGMDTSLNPSLNPEDGSIAAAMEQLDELAEFGGPGTLGVAAELTKALQSLPDIRRTGYCGLMLPVCEDRRLAELASKAPNRQLRITDLLSISSVCGVGVDTVPVPGNCTVQEVTGLILDVSGIASRWDKSLSLRVFPVPGKDSGDLTIFADSPYMVDSRIFAMQ